VKLGEGKILRELYFGGNKSFLLGKFGGTKVWVKV